MVHITYLKVANSGTINAWLSLVWIEGYVLRRRPLRTNIYSEFEWPLQPKTIFLFYHNLSSLGTRVKGKGFSPPHFEMSERLNAGPCASRVPVSPTPYGTYFFSSEL